MPLGKHDVLNPLFSRMTHRASRLVAVALFLLLAMEALAVEAVEVRADVCVVGGGSAGIGAAAGAARAGARVVLVEKLGKLGGTSANAYVSNWEPGPDGPLVREICDRLSKIPDAVALVADHNAGRKLGPFGLWLPEAGARYEQTLARSGRPRSDWRACSWEPDAFRQVVRAMLADTGRCRVLLGTAFTDADAADRRVRAIRAEADDGAVVRIEAQVGLVPPWHHEPPVWQLRVGE